MRGFTAKVIKSRSWEFVELGREPMSSGTVDIVMSFDNGSEPFQTIVLLPDEVEKLAKALTEYLETEND